MSKNSENFLIAKFKKYGLFFSALSFYINKRLFFYFDRFESAKDLLVGGLVAKRGRYVKVFLQSGLSVLFLMGISLAPVISKKLEQDNYGYIGEGRGGVLGQTMDVYATGLMTQASVKPRDSVMIYGVQKGETLSSIAKKFSVSVDTIRWQNDLISEDAISEGGELIVPPVTGIVHKVKRGDTIYSIAKKYNVDAQAIVNWPYNSYTDDENFGLAVGQTLVVPDGVKPKEKLWDPNAYLALENLTPNAGNVSPTGQFIWPTGGKVTQRFVWYHQGLDIANAGEPPVLAADAGTVIVAGWPDNSGYANRVIIDHGNGFVTLYAHLKSVNVVAGQTVDRGAQVGVMGSTGRSTGTHLHFEIRNNGAYLDPLTYLSQ